MHNIQLLCQQKQKELLKVDNIALFKSQHVTFLSDGTLSNIFLPINEEINTYIH